MATVGYVLIIHRVKDYAAWKSVFDQAAPLRQAAGERSFTVLRHDDDANCVVHYSQWDSTAAARAFFESSELVEIRRRAGVETPEFHYLQLLDQGIL
jgi:heme-degrading monooxygenase HmoA